MKKDLPEVGFKNLKKTLKKCRQGLQSHHDSVNSDRTASNCPLQCVVCDGTFFPSLLNEMSAIVSCFNDRAQKLFSLHLAKGFKKYYIWCKGKHDHSSLIQEGQDLVTYAMINAIAVRKILKKYDKIHDSKQAQKFRSQAQNMHVEILQSPWLCELMAFHINLREENPNAKTRTSSELFEGCYLKFTDGKPSLICELFNSIRLDIDLTCSVCLDTVFDPVTLTCCHILCYMCACSCASVTVVDGLQAASPKERCPLCREAGVYEGALHLDELYILLSRRCPDYWEERLELERAERVKQAKEYWKSKCRAFMDV